MTTIELEAPDGPIDALLNLPQGQGPWPGGVVMHHPVGGRRAKQAPNHRHPRAGGGGLTPHK